MFCNIFVCLLTLSSPSPEFWGSWGEGDIFWRTGSLEVRRPMGELPCHHSCGGRRRSPHGPFYQT